MSNRNILLVEDDSSLGFVIQDNLIQHGYKVSRCYNGDEGLSVYQNESFDLCILDVMLPKKDGFTLAQELRKIDNEVPIIFLTAKAMQEDKLTGFEVGGDDYITKPFHMRELIYRIEVFLKRTSRKPGVSTFAIGKYVFDHSNLSLKLHGKEKMLTQKEADVLRVLCSHKGEVVKREDILKEVWGSDDYFVGRSMDVFISKLRKYLKDDHSVEIINHHGVGFKFLC
ncbi:response regulator transcription factor [Fulvivirga sediminis]|uniref:Response regulator transcription factor n=1 Tax=Fulvivirga sediminis TaxID=2803949 RepID=A0A937JZR0_9BACT|nr:response regulator transcription factor [Fulvivirga sediminis]MBL3654687.1 response regulator transcription factor [Fulvivirga sediminis]